MKFAKCAQFAIGLVAGGGLVVVLGGNSLAADAASVSNSQLNAQQNTAIAPTLKQPADQASAVGGLVVGEDSRSKPRAKPDSPATTDSTNSTIAKYAQTESNTDVVSSVAAVVSGDTVSGERPGLGESSKPEASGAVQLPAGSLFARENIAAPDLHAAMDPSHRDATVPVISVVMPGGQGSGPDGGYVKVLPIQPVITNRSAVMGVDLAATVPSATLPSRMPAPAKSSGLWNRLTAVLAATVVPGLVSSPAGPVALHASVVVLWSVAVMLLAGGFTFSYGLWMRRGGFAHAARSDSGLFSAFAAVFLLGFVKARAREQSPIFSDINLMGSM